jgi:hypothetical protein
VRLVSGVTRVSPLDFYEYPISHSLVAVTGWAAVFGITYYGLRPYMHGACLRAVLVLSHWFLDAVVHRPHLPVMPPGPVRRTRIVEFRGRRPSPWKADCWCWEWSLCPHNREPRRHRTLGILDVNHPADCDLDQPCDLHQQSQGRSAQLTPPQRSARSLLITVPWGWWVDPHRELSRTSPAVHDLIRATI